MREVTKNCFVDLFQKQNNVASTVIDVIRHSISASDNDLLTAPFTKGEFRDAMFSMHPDKCPRPVGYSP